MKEILYRPLAYEELHTALFCHFVRHQRVTKCWRREGENWVIRDDPFIDDWSEAEYAYLVECLKNTLATGGTVYGAFVHGQLKGFVSVEAGLFGGENRYMDVTSLHVSEELRGRGVGRNLLEAAKSWARKQGARKLYFSAHSAVETQAFYKAMGCVEAVEPCQAHVDKEPFDCQLECVL